MKKEFTILLVILLAACTSNSDIISQNNWKYGEGYHIGDWLTFDRSGYYRISNDTIFKQDTAVAIVVEENEQAGSNAKLTIKSLQTGEVGTYHNK